MHSNAVITGLHVLYPQYLETLPKTAVIKQQVIQLQLPLVAPNILTSTNSKCYSDSYSCCGFLICYSSNDYDPTIGISDGLSFKFM